MTDSKRTCPECGLDYVPKGKGKGCPHCLLRLAMATSGEEPGEPSTEIPVPPGLKSRFFGDYEILGELARGGMGVVYRARQLSLNRVVALKMIQAGHLLSTEAQLRFRVEIEAVAQLNHPNIVSLYETGEHGGIHYFTMRLIEGGNLSERLATKRAVRENIALLLKVCRTLHYAHQRGILHRDLKPSNILVDPQGEPHVADFGLAKSLEHETGFTYSSSILGSPNYMAPEQASSHAGPVTTAADVYGLGAILYQMLTGRPPFQGRTALETVRQVVDAQPVPPRRLNPQVDSDLATIALKCLEKKPADRYESAEDLARDLERWLQGMPIHARPVGPVGTLWRWSRRHPAVATLSAVLAVVLIGGMIGVSIAAVRIRDAQREAVSHLRLSLLDQVRLLRLSKQAGVRAEGIRLVRQAVALGGTPEFMERARDELLACLVFTDMTFSPQGTVPTGDPGLSLMDPQFERVAGVVQQTNLVVRNLADGAELLRLAAGTSTVARVEAFSPDGRHLALRHTGGLSIWDTRTGRRCLATNGWDRAFAFASHAPQVFIEDGAGEFGVSVYELPEGRLVRRVPAAPPRGVGSLGWRMLSVSPDGNWMAGARRSDSSLEVVELESGISRWRTPPDDGLILAIAWQPSHGRVVGAFSDAMLRFYSWEDGEGKARFPVGVVGRAVAFDQSDTLLAVAGIDQSVRLWDLVSYRPTVVQCDARELWFDPAGERLGGVQRGDRVGWLDLARSSEYQEIVTRSGGRIDRCEFSPDGRWLASGTSGQIDVRRVSDGRGLAKLPVERMPIFTFDPLGDGVITSDSRGVHHRPLQEVAGGEITPGPPRRIVSGMRWRSLAYSGDGRRFFAANAASNTVYVFDRTLTNLVATVGPHAGVAALATTRDGRLVATGSLPGRDVRVWDVETGAGYVAASMNPLTRLALSPDGRWLLVHGDQFDFRDVRTRQPAPPLPFPGGRPLTGAACFSHDGRVLAVVVDHHEVQLFDLATWKALGRLRAPREMRLATLNFSHDSSKLAAATSSDRLRIWDLSQIRRQLAAANLDWENSPFPMAGP